MNPIQEINTFLDCKEKKNIKKEKKKLEKIKKEVNDIK